MNAWPANFVLALAILALAGCASVFIPDAMLEDARTYVYGVRSDPQVISYASAEIDQAVVTLRRADDAVARGGTLAEVHELASLARERATLAQQAARTKVAEAAAQAERQQLEFVARAREAQAAQRAAREAQLQADSSRQQAESSRQQAFAAQQQAAAAQRQAESAQQHAAAVQQQAPPAEGSLSALQQHLFDLSPKMTDRGLVVTLNDIQFDRGGGELQSAGHQAVSRLAVYLTAHPDRVISVEGFTDSAGDTHWSQQLSERRAVAVQSALAALGVDARRIIVRGYGPAFPLASNDTAAGRQMNRRVEIVISDRGYVMPRA